MALFLNEREVAQLLPMDECITALEESFKHAGSGSVEIKPRSRMRMPNGFFHFMAAADEAHQVFGYKAYPSFAGPDGSKFIVMLYDYESGKLLTCMESGRLGQIRTGAASGLASKYMAKKEASTVAIFGSGFQARTQLEAICCACNIQKAKVYSRREERRNNFATQMSERLELTVEAVDNPQECVSDADIVVTITSARDPVFEGKDLAPGCHVNAAGGNHWLRREIDEDTMKRSDLIVVDSLEQAKLECGDLLWLEARGSFRWNMVTELQDVVGGRIKARASNDSITLFESMGIGLEDIAAAQLVYKKAIEQGVGVELPF